MSVAVELRSFAAACPHWPALERAVERARLTLLFGALLARCQAQLPTRGGERRRAATVLHAFANQLAESVDRGPCMAPSWTLRIVGERARHARAIADLARKVAEWAEREREADENLAS